MLHGKRQAENLMARDYDYIDKVATLVALRDGEFLSYKHSLQRSVAGVTRRFRYAHDSQDR